MSNTDVNQKEALELIKNYIAKYGLSFPNAINNSLRNQRIKEAQQAGVLPADVNISRLLYLFERAGYSRTYPEGVFGDLVWTPKSD